MTYGSISFNIQVFLTQLFKQLSDSTLESRLNLTNVEESQVFHLCCYMLDYQNILHYYVTYLLHSLHKSDKTEIILLKVLISRSYPVKLSIGNSYEFYAVKMTFMKTIC